MKSVFYSILLLLVLPARAQVMFNVNEKAFFSKQDLVFDSLSTKWEEGAFLGNGLLGVMVYRENENAIRFDLGRTDVVDHRPGINPSIGRARLPIGRFVWRASSNIREINLRLDLWNAELTGTVYTDNGPVQLQVLVPATKDIILVNTTAPRTGKFFDWEWMPEKSISPFLTLGRDSASKYESNPDFVISKEAHINYNYQQLFVGGSYTTAWQENNSTNKSSLIITVENTYPADNSKARAKQVLDEVSLTSVPLLINVHRSKWHNFYSKSFISIPDSRLNAFWWIQQYKMGSATRVGSYPIDLMGPWYKPSPWPKYWWNLNIQLTYYPFFSSNHIEQALPLLKMVDDHIGNLSKNAPAPYHHNSAALARSGPYDMVSPVRVLKGNDSTGASSASFELGNLTWLLHVYWQAYEHTMDKDYMKSIYPVLTRAINYYLNVVEKQADGKYHLPYTYSPEYPKGITRDANYDLSVLNWGLKTLLYVNDQLKYNDTLAAKWKEILGNLTPYPQDQLGLRIGRDADFSISHRHYSHLLMIYPIYDINWDQTANHDLITRSLKQWESHDEAWRGYSYSGAGSIHAMMGEGTITWKLLNEMIDKGRFAVKPNTMYLEAGPVIETPLSAVTTINEMLLQSWGGSIRIFPAVPAEWKEASFDKLLAKGGFEVSAVRKNGQTQFIRIKSLAGEPCLVKTGLTADVKAYGKRVFKVTNQGGDRVAIDLRKGEEVVLYAGAKPLVFTMMEAATDGKSNWWGLHAPQRR
ncbi:alpha-L-fucosidase [Segetibacter sp. 3557_3]|uniref:glycosyl hydrolase family 95 catalytic domain-containing protein n=1 Tax=Segetibacter sp. 3557_3 TaxID=2547429 RepID=UPI0010587BFB|nr:alpha-L-fucosidase [Segetibacter sp. 3557_3]TDH20083.1 alpha-L-fucosidase [Segetibacter sp. 3557_3]